MGEPHVHPEAGQEHEQPLRHRQRLGIARGVGPGDGNRFARHAVGKSLAQEREIGERLRRMIDVALQVHDRNDALVAAGAEVVGDPLLQAARADSRERC